MSDLLRKKQPGKIQRSQSVMPKNTFNIKDLEDDKENVKVPESTSVSIPKKPTVSNIVAEKSSTVRVNMSTKSKLNALVTIGIASTVDEVVDLLINDYLTNILTKDERKQFEIILELYKRKMK